MPASISCLSTSLDSEAGPIVATIFVLLLSFIYVKIPNYALISAKVHLLDTQPIPCPIFLSGRVCSFFLPRFAGLLQPKNNLCAYVLQSKNVCCLYWQAGNIREKVLPAQSHT